MLHTMCFSCPPIDTCLVASQASLCAQILDSDDSDSWTATLQWHSQAKAEASDLVRADFFLSQVSVACLSPATTLALIMSMVLAQRSGTLTKLIYAGRSTLLAADLRAALCQGQLRPM